MAAVAISGAAEAVQETGKEAIKVAKDIQQYSYGVMKREVPFFDYEKVFWNSTWTVGLIGLTWMSVKLGQFIKYLAVAMKGLEEFAKNPLQFGVEETALFNYVYMYVEGSKSDPVAYPLDQYNFWTPSFGFGGLLPATSLESVRKGMAQYCRQNLDWYTSYKDRFLFKHPNWVPSEAEPIELVGDVLDQIDSFFSAYGPLMPVGAVGGHTLLEYIRKRKYFSENENKTVMVGAGLAGLGILWSMQPKPLHGSGSNSLPGVLIEQYRAFRVMKENEVYKAYLLQNNVWTLMFTDASLAALRSIIDGYWLQVGVG